MTPAEVCARLRGRFGAEVVLAFADQALQPFAVVAAPRVAEVAGFLRSEGDLAFDNLMCLSAVDWLKEVPPRLEVVYHLLSYRHGHTFVLKVHLPREAPEVPTVEGVWGVANWHEREAFDLFGITFRGHSDLRRILLPDDWVGFPLRKDWKDPEFYNGMRVKPTAQMAERALQGEALGIGPFADDPPNRHVVR